MEVLEIMFLVSTAVVTTYGQTPVIELKCSGPLDLITVVDGSDSISKDDFATIKNAILSLIDKLILGDNHVRFGLVLYSSNITTVIELSTSKEQIMTKVASLEHARQGTHTHLGIREMNIMFAQQGRTGVSKVGIVITDGISKLPEETVVEADVAKSNGINMFAVGIGEHIDTKELNKTASSADQAISVKSADHLTTIMLSLMKQVCPKPSPTTTTTTIPTDSSTIVVATTEQPTKGTKTSADCISLEHIFSCGSKLARLFRKCDSSSKQRAEDSRQDFKPKFVFRNDDFEREEIYQKARHDFEREEIYQNARQGAGLARQFFKPKLIFRNDDFETEGNNRRARQGDHDARPNFKPKLVLKNDEREEKFRKTRPVISVAEPNSKPKFVFKKDDLESEESDRKAKQGTVDDTVISHRTKFTEDSADEEEDKVSKNIARRGRGNVLFGKVFNDDRKQYNRMPHKNHLIGPTGYKECDD